jgi:hypothetical protein
MRSGHSLSPVERAGDRFFRAGGDAGSCGTALFVRVADCTIMQGKNNSDPCGISIS